MGNEQTVHKNQFNQIANDNDNHVMLLVCGYMRREYDRQFVHGNKGIITITFAYSNCDIPSVVFNSNSNLKKNAKEIAALYTSMTNNSLLYDAPNRHITNISSIRIRLIDVLTTVNNEQRQFFQRKFAKHQNLKKTIGDVFGNTRIRYLLCYLLHPPLMYNYVWLKNAIEEQNMDLLMELICSLDSDEFKETKDFYDYHSENSDLVNDIESAMFNNKHKTAKSMIRNIFKYKCSNQTNKKYKLDANKLLHGKDDAKKKYLSDWFSRNSYKQIKSEIEKFNSKSCISFETCVNKVFKNGKSAVIVKNIMLFSMNKNRYFVDRIEKTFDKIDCCEDSINYDLVRILVSRSEKDLGNILGFYDQYFGMTLQQKLENNYALMDPLFLRGLLNIINVSPTSAL